MYSILVAGASRNIACSADEEIAGPISFCTILLNVLNNLIYSLPSLPNNGVIKLSNVNTGPVTSCGPNPSVINLFKATGSISTPPAIPCLGFNID